MCRIDEMIPPKAVRADSVLTSSASSVSNYDSESSNSDSNFAQGSGSPLAHMKVLGGDQAEELYAEFEKRHFFSSVLTGAIGAAVVTGFALLFPFILAPEAASKTYDWAFYSYDDRLSHFDNTVWTYGTDYTLAAITGSIALCILSNAHAGVSDRLCTRAASLLLGYSASTLAGGYCHQNYMTLEERNSLSFRFLWTICVGTVTAASCSMGASGTEVIRKFQSQPDCHPLLQKVPILPETFWWTFGILVTAVCAGGGLSFQRPACDIFVAGITQFPSTFYLMIFFALVQHPFVHNSAKFIGFVGFILNAPLLPMYPLLVQYTDWSLASINTLLHTVLCVAWSMQGYSLNHMAQALVSSNAKVGSSKKAL